MNNVVHIKIQVVVLLIVGVGLRDVDRHGNAIDLLWLLLDDIGSNLWILVCKPKMGQDPWKICTSTRTVSE